MTSWARLRPAALRIAPVVVGGVQPADGDVVARAHLVSDEVLEDDADLAVQILDVVLAQVDAVEQDTARRRVVQTRDQLHQRGLALPVLTDEGNALAAGDAEVEVVEDRPRVARVLERDVLEHEAVANRPRRRYRVRDLSTASASRGRTRRDR